MSWNDLAAHRTMCISGKLIQIGDSIWYSSHCDWGAKGMVEYCNKTNKMISKVAYPKNIKPEYHSVCGYNNQIYIVDGKNGQIILFDPFTKRFEIKAKISKIGQGSSCIAVDSDIHIFNDRPNQNHLIFLYKKHAKFKTQKDETRTKGTAYAAVLKYENKIIKFAGLNVGTMKCVDILFMSSAIRNNISDNITWTCKNEWRLNIPVL